MTMDIRVSVRALALLAMVAASLSAFGATVTWDGGGGDNYWATATNWSTDLVPTSSDDVIITNVTGIAMVNANPTVKSITVQNGAFLRIEPGQILTVTNGSLIAAGGTLHITSTATWSGNGSLTVNGAVNMNGNSTFDGSGTLNIGSSGSLDVVSNANFSIIARTIINAGTITLQNDVMTGITFNGATLSNTGTIDFQTNQGINTTMGTPILTNLAGGIMKKSVGGGSAVITFPVDNQAGGTIQVLTGSLALNGGGTGSGTYSIASGKTLTLGGGTLTLTGSPTFSGTGTVSIAGGTLNAATAVTLNNVALSTAGTITGTGAVNVSGTFDWLGGTITGSGPKVLTSTSVPSITCSGSDCLLDGAALQLQASTLFDAIGTNLVLSNGASLTIAAGKSLSITASGDVFDGGGATSSIINNGTIWKKNTAGTSTFAVPVTLSGSSTLQIDDGKALFSADVTVAAGATIAIVASQTLEVAGGVFLFNGPGTNATGNFTVSGGTLRVPTAITRSIANVTLQGGTIDGGGTLILSGTSTWAGGTMGSATSPGGITQINSGDTLNIGGAAAQSLTQTRQLLNNGTVNYNSTAPNTLTVSGNARITNNGALELKSNGALDNSGSALIENFGNMSKSLGAGTSIIGPRVENNAGGTLSVITGDVEIFGGGIAAGAYAISSGHNLLLAGGTFTVSSTATVTGGGYLYVALTGATLDVGAGVDLTCPNVFLQAGGTITGAGAVRVSSNFIWSGGTIAGSGPRVLNSTSTVSIICDTGICLLDGAALQIQASATFSASTNAVMLSNAASLTIDAGKTLSVTNDGDFTNGGGVASSIINNGGIWKETSGGVSVLGVPVTLSATSTVQIDAGTLQFGSGATVASGATINIATSKTLEVTGGVFQFNSGGVTMPLPGSSGNFNVSGGTLRVATGTMTVPNVTLQGSGVIDGAGTLILSGPSSWIGGTMGSATAPGGITQINSGNTLTIGGAAAKSLTQARQLLNNGTVNYSSAGGFVLTMSGNSKITNNSAFNLTANDDIALSGSALIENYGTLAKTGGVATTNLFPRVENNAGGTVSVTTGTLELRGGGIAGGAYAITSVLTLTAGTFTVASTSTVTGAGTLAINGATADISSGANVTWPNVNLNAGTIAGAGTLHVSGTFNWLAGTIGGSGPRVLNSTSTSTISCSTCPLDGAPLQLQASATFSGSAISFLNGASLTLDPGKTLSITNNGDFLSGVGGGSIVNNGTFWKKTTNGISTIGVPVTLSATSTLDIDAGRLQFGGGADVAAGATLDVAFGAGELDVTGGVFQFNSGPISMPGSGTFSVSTGTLRVPTGVTVTVSKLTLEATGVIDGGGTLILSGASLWDSGTMGSAAAPGGITQINSGSTLTMSNFGLSQTLTQGRELRNSGTVNYYGGGSPLTMSAAGKITNNAVFNLASDANINLSGSATIDNNGTLTKNGGTGNSTLFPVLNNAGTVSVTTGTLAFAGGGTNSGSFNVTAPGNLAFSSGTNSISGGGSISGTGTLTVAGATVTAGVPVNVGALHITGGTLTLNASGSAVSAFAMSAGSLGGSGTLTLTNGGTWTGGTRSGSGTTINPAAKTLNIPTPVTLNSTLQNDGTISVNGNMAGSGTIANNGTLNTGANITIGPTVNNGGQVSTSALLSLAGNGSHSGTFTASGPLGVIDFSGGTQTISGAFAGTGKFRFSGAAATVNGAWSGMAIEVTGGSVALNTSGTLPALNLSGGTLAGSGALTVTGASTWSGGTISGNGALTFDAGATVTMPGTNATTLARPLLNSGTINFTAASSAMLIDNVPITNNGTFDIQSSQVIMVTAGTPPFMNNGTLKKSSGAGMMQFAAPVMNSGVVEIDAGTLNVSGTFAQSAGTTDVRPGATLQTATLALNGGSLIGNGTVAGTVDNHAIVAPGASPGTLTISGDYVQASNGVLNIQIGGTAPGTQYDRLTVSGSVTLGGTLNISAINSFIPAAGNGFQILTFGTPSNSTTFAFINGLDYGSGLALVPTYGANNLQLITNNVQADLTASVIAPSSVANGSAFTYTVNITNQGGSNATAVTFNAPLPANVTFNSASPAICSGAPNLVCTVGALPNQSAAVVVLNVTAKSAGAAPVIVSTVGNEFDPNGGNNTASASPLITGAADLRIAVSGPPTTLSGSQAIYTIVVTNSGPDLANNVAVSVAASPGLTFNANSGACAGSFPCTINALSSGQSATINSAWDISPTATGSVQLTVNAASSMGDPNSSNNHASATTLIGTCPAIIIDAPAELRTGASGQATATPFGGAVYNWAISNGTIDSGNGTATIAFTAGTAGTATLAVNVTGGGCTLRTAVQITVKPRPTCQGTAAPTAPADSSITADATVNFSWTEVAGASGYRLWLQQAGAPAQSLGRTLDTSLTKIIPPGVQQWYVETLFDGCASHESTHVALTILAAQDCANHGAPQLSAPSTDTLVTSATVAFRWDAVPNAIDYELWLAPAGGTPTLLRAASDTSYTAAVPQGRLEWYVRALFGGCAATESTHRSFTYTPPPDCTSQRPLLIQPAEGEQLTSPVSFEWREVVGATSYELYIDGVVAATTTSAHASGIIVPPDERRWRVRARLAEGCAALDSAESRFAVIAAPPSCSPLEAPVVTAPGQISSDVTGRVQWTFVAGATQYVVQISTDPQFSPAATSSSVVLDRQLPFAFTNESDLPVARYVRVYAVDTKCVAAGTGPFSPVAVVSVVPRSGSGGVASLTDPTDVPYTLNIAPEFAGLSFSAEATVPWMTVTPPSGIVPPGGQKLLAVAHTAGLPPGASSGNVVITTAGAGKLGALGTTPPVKVPITVNNIPGVTKKPKNTPPPDALTIPAVANVKNFIVRYQSDVCVTNTSAQVIKYQVNFTPSGLPGITEGQTTNVSVEPGATLALNDIVTTWFGGLTSTGTLEIRPLTETATSTSSAASTGLADRTTFASSRTFAVTAAGGTYGQYIPAVPYTNFVGQGAVLSMQQIAQSDKYHTNLGLVEGSGEAVTLEVRIFDGAGTKRAEFNVDLTGGQHTQINSVVQAHGITLDDGRIEVEVTKGAGKVTAYASVIENATSDALLVPPVTINDAGHTKWVVPGVAGFTSASSNWQSDVRIFNAGKAAIDLTLAFYSRNGGTATTRTITLAAGEVRQFDRMLSSFFAIVQDAGALHVSTADPARLVITARTYNETGQGAYGQFIAAVTPEEAVSVGSRPLQILQVEESAQYRSNVGFAEVSGNAVTLEVSVFRPNDKAPTLLEVKLGPNEFRQIASLLSTVGLADTFNARISVRAVDGEGRATAYLSLIDMKTGDPTYIPGQ
jgi:uncharacterized repeat protein (TIGR01451 family)